MARQNPMSCLTDDSAMRDGASGYTQEGSVKHDDVLSQNSDGMKLRETRRRERFVRFRHRRDSLRLHASRVAALAGFHPFANLPEIMMQLVYQGPVGQELLHQDAKAIGLVLQSEEELLRELAKKASADTTKALQTALNVKKGKEVLNTVHNADEIKKKVVEEATKSKRLSAKELNVLQERVRSSVDTGYGTHHEDEALDLYEKQCGWEVSDRNSQVLSWPFAKAEDLEFSESEIQLEGTVVPLARPSPVWRAHVSDTKEYSGSPIHEPLSNEPSETDEKCSTTTISKLGRTSATLDTLETPSIRPFFSISGAVDGIRQELWYPPDKVGVVDDDWVIRSIIVECKHRMKRSFRAPPLYDQIQTTVYCLMHNVEEADLVQVMRKEKTGMKRKLKNSAIDENGASSSKKAVTIQQYFEPHARQPDTPVLGEPRLGDKDHIGDTTEKCLHGTLEENTINVPSSCETTPAELAESGSESQFRVVQDKTDKGPASRSPKVDSSGHTASQDNTSTAKIGVDNGTQQPTTSIEIDVYRMAVDDPIMQHRQNWQQVILPRLRSFVEAVYSIRADDTKRYTLLQGASDPLDTSASWDMLHSECPWLKDCDTAFGRTFDIP